MINRDNKGRFDKGNQSWKLRKRSGHKKGEFKHTKETKEKIKQTNIRKNIKPPIIYGKIPWNKNKKGIHLSSKSEWKKGQQAWNKDIKKEKSHSWKGGLSYLPYSNKFDENLKEKIRKRDNRKCQLCGINEKELFMKNRNGKIVISRLAIHHIDYNKQNCEDNNLISLCKRCNTLVNFERNKWIDFFYRRIN